MIPYGAQTPAVPIVGQLSLTDPDSCTRRFTAADDAFCRALFHEHHAAEFAPLGLSNSGLHAMLNQQFDAQRFGYARQFPDAEQCIVVHAGSDVGRVIMTMQRSQPVLPEADAKRSLSGGTLHLIDITIAAAARRRGIGSDVIESLSRAAHALGATRFTLFVLQTNGAARRLYERLGFVATSDGVYIEMVRHLR